MTTLRRTAHRWWIVAYVIASVAAAAVRHSRRVRHRRRSYEVDVWPW